MVRCVIVGSGNIGTDLMYKLHRSRDLELRAVVGIDPESPGLERAAELGYEVAHDGIDWVERRSGEFDLVFEATSAAIHKKHAPVYQRLGVTAIDLTPARIGPPVVPGVNLESHLSATNLNLITCGGQATAPIVAAVSRIHAVPYAEIVSTVASDSAGPGTRQNIDEFTSTTSACLEEVGGAGIGKAIMVLNPANPPIHMRNTVYCGLTDGYDEDEVRSSVESAIESVQAYVPGYELKNELVFEHGPFNTPAGSVPTRLIVLLEVAGAGDFLPKHAGNLDIMTAAAVRVGESVARASDWN